MAHKKSTSEQAGVRLAEISPRKVAKASSNIRRIEPPMSTKHRPSDEAAVNDADESIASDRSTKRRKFNGNTGLDHHDPPSPGIPESTTTETIEGRELATDASTPELPHEVRHLSSKYDFTTMSIRSSARINDKVKTLLLRVEKFSFADPKSKPGVAILHAKSEVASKMISVVEIAKKEIEHGKGKWWQYSKLDGRIAQLKTKPVKRRVDGKTLSEWQMEGAGGRSEEVEEVEEVVGETGRASKEDQHNHDVGPGDEEMEDAFESMVNPKEVDQGSKQSRDGSGRKLRAFPVMTIYFARVPVPGLKELYGEQTNP